MLGPNPIGPERPITGRGPVIGANLRITWAQVTVPDCTITGQAQVIGAILNVWAGHMAQFLQTWNNSKTVPISE